MSNEVENYAMRVRSGGASAWEKTSIQNLGDIEDGDLLQLYVDAKSKAEEFKKAHEKFLNYVEKSGKYDFER